MEGKIKKLLMASGATLSMAVALIPLTSYAVPSTSITDSHFPEPTPASGNTSVYVNVKDSISLDTVSGGSKIVVSSGKVGTGTLSANVTSTGTYTISLKAVNSANLRNSGNTSNIPAGTNVQAGTSAWGIKKQNQSNYTALNTTNSQVFYEGAGAGLNTSIKTDFEVGVSVSSSVKSDDYSAEVEVLAAIKN